MQQSFTDALVLNMNLSIFCLTIFFSDFEGAGARPPKYASGLLEVIVVELGQGRDRGNDGMGSISQAC